MDTFSISQDRNTFSWISIASKAYDFSRALAHIYSHVKEKDVTLTPLTHWYTKVEKTGFKSLNTVVKIMQNHYLKIINFINRRSINTSAEAVNAKV